jgi:4-amino-4-deoxy-L-arabinose transferase-like glycosyltransferase
MQSSDMNDKAFSRFLIGILAFALVVRVIWAFFVPVIHVSDPDAYDRLAKTIIQHGVYGWTKDNPTAYYPIGTSAFYASVYWLLGTSEWAIKFVNLCLGLVIVFLTIQLSLQWFDRRISLIAGALVAAWPVFIQYTTILASELIFTIALLGALFLFEKVLKANSRLWLLAILTGCLAAVSSLIRPTALFLPAVLGIVFAWQKRNFFLTMKLVALMAVAMISVMTPWIYRNYKLFNEPISGSSSAGANFWMGNNPNTTGFYEPPPQFDSTLNEAQIDAELRREAIAYIKERPLAFIGRTLVKAVRLYERETIGISWNAEGLQQTFGSRSLIIVKVISQIYWSVALVLFAWGCALYSSASFASPSLNSGLVVMAYSTALYAIIVIQDRYHIPTNPIMAPFAACAIAHLFSRLPKLSRLGRWLGRNFPRTTGNFPD